MAKRITLEDHELVTIHYLIEFWAGTGNKDEEMVALAKAMLAGEAIGILHAKVEYAIARPDRSGHTASYREAEEKYLARTEPGYKL